MTALDCIDLFGKSEHLKVGMALLKLVIEKAANEVK
jgi:hypothetical protein